MTTEKNTGTISAIGAFLIWGLMPIYFKFLELFSPLELMAYRVIWSFLTIFFILVFQIKFLPTAKAILFGKQFFKLISATTLIGINWFLFVYAIDNDQILQASLGYFLGPILSIGLGFIFLKEKISKIKLFAVGFALISVLFQLLDSTGVSWLSVSLALTFALYGIQKKFINLKSIESVTFETFVLFIPSFVCLFYLEASGQGHYLDASSVEQLLLIFSGTITTVPLILFSKAAKSIPISSLGLIQYIAPTLQFMVATVIYNEKLSQFRLIAFILICCSSTLTIYSSFKKSKEI